MSLVYDEYGRPFIVIRDQGQKTRIKGLDAQKVRGRPAGRPWARAAHPLPSFASRAPPPPFPRAAD